MSKDYSVKIVNTTKELTPKERVAIKDLSDAKSLADLKENETQIINVDYSAELSIHNEQAENKDYNVFVIVDKEGTKYYTSSQSFMSAYSNIADEMADYPDEEYSIKVFTKPSKNYKGKAFLTCTII